MFTATSARVSPAGSYEDTDWKAQEMLRRNHAQTRARYKLVLTYIDLRFELVIRNP